MLKLSKNHPHDNAFAPNLEIECAVMIKKRGGGEDIRQTDTEQAYKVNTGSFQICILGMDYS